MLYLAYPATAGGVCVVKLPPGQTAAQTAQSFGLTMAVCAGFDMSTFDAGSENFPNAFSVVNNQPAANTVSFSLPLCKNAATLTVQSNYAGFEQTAANGYTSQSIAAQSALPEIDRIPAIQSAIEQINVLSEGLQTSLAAIAAATNATEVSEVAFPPTGTIFTGRGAGNGPLDLNISEYTVFNSATLTEADTELYIPGTNTVIPYGNPVPGKFDSLGNCFAVGDYVVQIRVATTEGPPGRVLAAFECPLNPAGENVQFSLAPAL
jgi:hypothetical protein